MSNFDLVVKSCQDLLYNFYEAEKVREYADNRISRESQQKFCFGYFPKHNNLQALISSVGEEPLSKLELIYDKVIYDSLAIRKSRHGILEDHNLIMPYRDVYGNIIALVGRTILNDDERNGLDIPKYKNTSFDKGKHLFGLYESKNNIVKNNHVFIVEGQFDCISSHNKGLFNVVALGSSNMTFEQFSLISRYTNNIILMLDNDAAGQTGSERIIKKYSKLANIKNACLPKGYKDIDEYFIDNSIESLRYTFK